MKLNDYFSQADYFYTYDLGCSAALVSAGFELIFLDKQNPKKAQFVFKRREGLEETIDQYFSGKLSLPARSLFDNIRMLKNRLYSI